MVRLKQRYVLCEIVTPDERRLMCHTWKSHDVYTCVRNAIVKAHGDYGIAIMQSSLSVKYLNALTRIVLLRVRRGLHHMLIQSLMFVNKLNNQDVFLHTLHISGTIRSCEKFLVRYHYWQLPVLLRDCTTAEERYKVEQSMKKCLEKLTSHTNSSTKRTAV